MRKIAILGGTGIQDPSPKNQLEALTIQTPFGPAFCEKGSIYGNQVVFLARHGKGHSVPPHKINYRANIWALKYLGTEEILATAAVGSANKQMIPGSFVVCDQILDFTKNRVNTFYNGQKNLVAHVDFTNPYCPFLRKKVIEAMEKLCIPFFRTGCYVTSEGPRYETAAEIKMIAQLGGDLVGMTGMPEAFLAREAEMCYVNVSLVTNMAAGISTKLLTHEEVEENMQRYSQQMNAVLNLFMKDEEPSPEECSCHHAMKDFGGFQLNAFNE